MLGRVIHVAMAAFLAVWGWAGAAQAAEDKVVYLTSLDWPPYTAANLPHGASEEVVRQAFAAMGYRLVTDFFPWNRAVANAKSDPKYVGYYPEYFAPEIEAEFLFSDAMGIGPLGFAEVKSAPVTWSSLDDLKNIPIGAVSGYVNTTDFDARAKAGSLLIDEAQSDTINLKKLAGGRIKLAVIDKNVMDHLLKTDPDLAKAAEILQFNGKVLEEKALYVCFRNDAKGQEMAAIFNQGLKKIDPVAIMAAYLKNLK